MTDLLYILSPSYSGSTLLTFLLAGHPRIGTVGELKATAMGDLDQYYCSCQSAIRKCPFWHKLTNQLAQKGVTLDLADFGTHFCAPWRPVVDRLIRACPRGTIFELARDISLKFIPGAGREIEQIIEKNRVVIEAILKLQQADVFLDASKESVRLKYLLKAGYWNIKAVHLVRDGRGVACSYMKHYDVPMEIAALEWKQTHRQCQIMVSALPGDSCITVHYEQLCADPEGTVKAIFDLVKLDPNQGRTDLHPAEHHILGNYMRLKRSGTIKLDEKWKTTLSAEQLAAFDQVAGDINRQYGYE